jgi:hypothetical protein
MFCGIVGFNPFAISVSDGDKLMAATMEANAKAEASITDTFSMPLRPLLYADGRSMADIISFYFKF